MSKAARYWLRVVLLLVASKLPLPFVPALYTATFVAVTNPILAVALHAAPEGVHLEAAEPFAMRGSWLAHMHLENRQTHKSTLANFDVRAFSFLPFATFVAIVGAATFTRWRERAIAWGAGLVALYLMMLVVNAIPVLANFAVAGLLPQWLSLLVLTLYGGLCTATLIFYALPALLGWGMIALARRDAHTAPAAGKAASENQAAAAA
jgi:hypothetical protein